MAQLPLFTKANDQNFTLMNSQWAALLNPVLANLLVQGIPLKNVPIINGNNVINHLLGRMMQGWIITDIDAGAAIYRSSPLNDKTISLTSGASCTISLWVF